jgi:hypothetical protein
MAHATHLAIPHTNSTREFGITKKESHALAGTSQFFRSYQNARHARTKKAIMMMREGGNDSDACVLVDWAMKSHTTLFCTKSDPDNFLESPSYQQDTVAEAPHRQVQHSAGQLGHHLVLSHLAVMPVVNPSVLKDRVP